jgi:hypothetical protein
MVGTLTLTPTLSLLISAICLNHSTIESEVHLTKDHSIFTHQCYIYSPDKESLYLHSSAFYLCIQSELSEHLAKNPSHEIVQILKVGAGPF